MMHWITQSICFPENRSNEITEQVDPGKYEIWGHLASFLCGKKSGRGKGTDLLLLFLKNCSDCIYHFLPVINRNQIGPKHKISIDNKQNTY